MRLARVAGAVGVLGVGALVLSGCGISLTHHEYQDEKAIGPRITSVRVENTSGLKIHIGNTTTVHRTVRYAENDPGKNTFRVDGDALVLQDCEHDDCDVMYDVT